MPKKLDEASVIKRVRKTSDKIKESNDYEKTEMIPVESIKFNKDNFFNIFDTDETISELARSIEENGLIHSILVMRNGSEGYLLISGERRLRAFIKLGRPAIRATVVPKMSELDILRKTFYGNTEVRQYTTEQKLRIIHMYEEKLSELGDKEYYTEAFKKDIAQAFGVDTRQVNKFLAIDNGLIEPLVEMLCDEKLDINTAAQLSRIPEDCQRLIAENFDNMLSDPERLSAAKAEAVGFARKIKAAESENLNATKKLRISRVYPERKIRELIEQLEGLKALDKNSETEQTEPRKSMYEEKLAKYRKDREKIDNELISAEEKKAAEIEKLKNDFRSGLDRRLDKDVLVSDPEAERRKKIEKELKLINSSLKRLVKLAPSDSLDKISDILAVFMREKRI